MNTDCDTDLMDTLNRQLDALDRELENTQDGPKKDTIQVQYDAVFKQRSISNLIR